MPIKRSASSSAKNNQKHTFSYVSYSSSSVVTPKQNIQQELVVQNNSGKIKGQYIQKENGKKTINKEFKSQKGFEAIQKLLHKEKTINRRNLRGSNLKSK